MDITDIVSIKTCCYSDMHDLLLTISLSRGQAA